MRIRDWSSDVCSSDLIALRLRQGAEDVAAQRGAQGRRLALHRQAVEGALIAGKAAHEAFGHALHPLADSEVAGAQFAQRMVHVLEEGLLQGLGQVAPRREVPLQRSEEHTSELQSLMRTSYAVFCLNKKHITQLT